MDDSNEKIVEQQVINHEYNFLINRYTDLVGFPIFVSTFKYMTDEEKHQLEARIRVLHKFLEDLLPKVQNRELNRNQQ